LKRELRDVTAQEAQKRVEMNVAAELAARLDEEIAGLTENLERLRAQQQNQEKEALALGHEQRKLAEDYQRASQKLSVARLDLDRIARETERAAAQKQESENEIATRETARSAEEAALGEAREALTRMQAEAQRIAEEHAALRAEMAGMEERSRAAQTAHQRLEAQTAELVRRKVQLAAELERFGVDRARLLADNIELDQKAATFAESIGLAEQEVAGLVTDEEQGRLSLAALGEALKQSRAASEELREKRTQIELELVRKQSEMKFLDETCKNELDTAVAELAAAVETPPEDDALAAAEDKYRELKGRIEALGPVNPQALEEYEEAQKRYDFLNTQRQDLLDSIRDTEKAIQEIDQESKKRFNEAFGKINENFREMFKILFNGGVGEMRLTDPENPDSGIDIVAQPPGKKLQNVLLMSGGERAMTAMSLLMAIFKYQPSPFCILDEVDAPLDEPNIIRLTKLVKEMSEQTQFIVITHAKRTMEASQVLYGVTMQEPGVSKLVSVKFNPLSAAVPPPAATAVSAATA
jgi:chromosome segregation protein